MAEDVGGSPYSDGADHGGADDEFATVVFDESFVRSAAVHEPSARERQLAAAETRFEPDQAGAARSYEFTSGSEVLPLELRPLPGGLDDDRFYPDPWSGGDRQHRRTRRSRLRAFDPLRGGTVAQQRWHRPVAWVLALVMGVGVVALAVAAVYRGVGGSPESPARPSSGTSSPGATPSTPPVVTVAVPAG
ncbi:SCO2584 family spore wall biosynthesis protein [Kitasatospora griseola]|uniref:SCO2584 family spore wall biosynthesis protein n=1 Tax=Kitasatospora griseola TaxID=2064 RepID=UPI003805BD8A